MSRRAAELRLIPSGNAMRVRHTSFLLLLSAALFSGCGDDSTGPSSHGPLRVVAGADVADTVLSPLLQALIVEVRDENGQPLEGAVVRFEGVHVDAQNQWSGYTAYVSPLDRDSYTGFAVDSSDRNGRARVLVQLGTKAGPASIVITVPDIGMVDTAHFTVQPGNAAGVVASPHDTAMYVGHHFTPQSAVVDRFQNPREDPVTYRVVGSSITLKDGVVTGAAVGKSQLIASVESIADTSFISVIPEMTLAAIKGRDIVLVNADGSGYRVLTTSTSGPVPYTTDWSPSGNDLVFDHGFSSGPINAVELDGDIRTITTSDEWGLYPDVSPDGSWVYYSRNIGEWRLYRVHLDGTGEEEVPMTTHLSDVVPSLAPDGNRLVYVATSEGDHLMLLDLASGVSTEMHIDGHSPAWSPSGDLIAFVSSSGGLLQAVSPTGTGVRTIGDPTSSYDFGIDWSPDGKWVIARNASHNVVELINVQSGEIMPLSFTTGFRGPSWKP